ncbi:hypothetical protein EXS62_03140 [Candidatus Kaiserbacteria bacterium]|nr:hypothetical protein [Candidatus Kaiserbacteria bacterium]
MRTFFIDRHIVFVLMTVALLMIVASPFEAMAQSGTSGTPEPSGMSGTPAPSGTSGSTFIRLDNPLGNITGFCGFMQKLFVAVGTIAVPIAVLFLVYAGFLFVWARGSVDGLTKAKNNLFYTILGIAIFFAAWLLALAIGNTLAQFGVSVVGNCQ